MAGLEWARVAGDTIVVASRSRFYFHRAMLCGDPFSKPMVKPGTEETTEKLLDGAAAAAHNDAPPWVRPEMTATRYVWRLAGHHITISNTSPLMRIAAERFGAAGRKDLAAHAHWVARVEDHGPMAARDIAALGHDPERVQRALVPPVAVALVELLRRYVHSRDPVTAFGWLYAMERSAVSLTPATVRAIEALLPVGRRATRTMRVHSSMGAEVDHLRKSIRVLAALPAADRTIVARATYETALTIRTPRAGDDPPESFLAETLAECPLASPDEVTHDVLARATTG